MLLVVSLITLSVVRSQMIRQCMCKDFLPCKNSAVASIISCADHCKNHVTELGASYPAFRSCLVSSEPMFNAMLKCQEQHLQGACTDSPGQMVPKRYPETMKIAAFTEINSMLTRSGIQNEAKNFLTTGKKFVTCIMKCSERGAGSCLKKLNCGLALPSDVEVIQTTKRCAIEGGLNTQALRNLCQCFVNTGLRSLAPICARIEIS
ncbi:hypothetical protein Angca_001366 [Angiostrongylus cantonensis]|uniref:Chondroitin proteoglycan 4 domain-containing protein n=1 Tax=Angiostrongylus cantonensis TaxID=6313 RepID=A0A0K0DID8_ANGCA|nr:hypothetical protein Angca_001366 [Angiostrongylus cantonensis]